MILGFVQTATENERVCTALLRELMERGLQIELGLLCVIDGAKGLRTAIADGLRVPGPRTAVSMAYAREQCGVPPEEPARALAPDAPGDLRATDL